MRIPFVDLREALRPILPQIEAAVQRVIYNGVCLRGLETEMFEAEWASSCGQRYCVASVSGTDALTLAGAR